MKTRFSAKPFLVIAIVLGAFLPQSRAQTFDALAFGGASQDIGYFGFAPGWTFVPTTDLRVVAVGYSDVVDATSFEIDFWDGTNQVIAAYPIGQSDIQTNGGYYQPVDGLTLKAGVSYSISVSNVPPGVLPVQIYSRQGADGIPTFSISPFLKQFGNFGVSTNRLWNPVPAQASNGDWLYFGPTFQFQVLRQLDFRELGANVVFSWPTQSVSYAVQQNSGFNTTKWVTVTNAPVVIGSQNQVTLPRPNGTMFYRMTSQ